MLRGLQLMGEDVGPPLRSSILNVSLLLAACAADPVPTPFGEVVGHYRYMVGPDEHEEFSFQPEGRLAWSRFSNAMLRERGIGKWSVSGDEVTLVLPGFSFALQGVAGTLALRRFRDHVYLVRDEDLRWFESHGPMAELCLVQDAAPLVILPRY